MYVALTIFLDLECTKLDRVVHLYGVSGEYWLKSARDYLGREIKEGEAILGVRVDRIGSELLEG